ncbi:MAG: TetR/AcrR family transcriptional regulator [Methanobacteriaceae archaeon]|jgi:AcrR family transcriptional regulator|nr:TetR/AcrR family transcriptional regulator [Methanobacteriaceae archaeon]
MPKVVPEYKKMAKIKIVQAAYKVFSDKGYHPSKMDEIAREVGVSKATLYSYFESKEDLLKMISISTSQRLNEIFQKSLEGQNSLKPFEELYNKMEEFQGSLHLNFEILSLSSHDKNIREIGRNIYDEKIDVFQVFLENLQSKGIIRDDIDARTLARLVAALYTDIAMQLVMGFDKSEVRETWNQSLSAILEK